MVATENLYSSIYRILKQLEISFQCIDYQFQGHWITWTQFSNVTVDTILDFKMTAISAAIPAFLGSVNHSDYNVLISLYNIVTVQAVVTVQTMETTARVWTAISHSIYADACGNSTLCALDLSVENQLFKITIFNYYPHLIFLFFQSRLFSRTLSSGEYIIVIAVTFHLSPAFTTQ